MENYLEKWGVIFLILLNNKTQKRTSFQKSTPKRNLIKNSQEK
jgi:hypothetical protein